MAALILPGDHGEALHGAVPECLKEGIVVLEDNAAVRVASRPKHIGVGEKTVTAEGLVSVDRRQAQRLHAVKDALAKPQVIDAGWRRPAHSDVDVLGIIQELAQTRMGFEL